MSILLALILIIIGFILLIKSAEFLVDGSSNIAKKFHIPEIVIGLTIVSIGTSLPELLISVSSGIKGYTDMSIGNVVGSCICNLLLILGISAIIRPLRFKRETRLIEIPICLLITSIFGIFCNTGAVVTRAEAVVLLALFMMFIVYTFIMGKKGEKFDLEEDDALEENSPSDSNFSILSNVIKILLGIVALKFGGDFVVDNATIIAENFDISEKIISLTILSIGTSLPELVTSIIAAQKNNSDLAIGNIIGSNIFNMALIVGVAALIKPIDFNISFNVEMVILFLSTIILLLLPLVKPINKMSRKNGIMFFLLYVIHMILLFKV